MPLSGMICHPFGKTWYNFPMCQIWHSHSWDMAAASKVQNRSRDVTTPLSGTVCGSYAGTSYDRPVYQIWNLYTDLLQRYETRQKMQKFGWFRGLGVTQNHQQHGHRAHKTSYSTLIETVSILYRFRVIAHFPSKVANFNPPHLHLSPHRGWFRSNFAMIFGMRKLEYLCYRVALLAWSYV